MKTTRILGALFATLCLASYAEDAHALGPVDVEVGLKGGYATNPSSISSIPNGLGPAFGFRAGVGVFGLYGGINVLRYFGQDSLSAWQEGVELGYSLKFSIVTIRPQLGLGNMETTFSTGGVDFNNGNFYLEPGVTGLVGFGLLYAGADVNALFLPSASNTNAVLTLHAQLGVKF